MMLRSIKDILKIKQNYSNKTKYIKGAVALLATAPLIY